MKNTDLTLIQRIFVIVLYVGSFIFLSRFFSGNFGFFLNSEDIYNQLFVSVALLLIFGSYIAEPFFTKPTDVLVNATGIFLFLLSINSPSSFVGYSLLKGLSIALIVLSLVAIFVSSVFKKNKWQEVFVDILVKIGRSKVAYSVIYLASLVSYFSDKPIAFSVFFTFWVVFATSFIAEGLVVYASKIFIYIFGEDKNSSYVGEAIGYENPYVFKVEIDLIKTKVSVVRGDLVRITLKGESEVLGVVVDQKVLLNRKWLTVYLLRENNDFVRVSQISFLNYKNFLANSYKVYKTTPTVLSSDIQEILENNSLYKNRNNFIGYVEQGSDINKIRFYILPNYDELGIVEGTVVSTRINNKDVLFQVIDGNTKEEGLDKHDKHSFISVVARKLGEYNLANKEISSVRWLPEMYSPVFLLEKNRVITDETNSKVIGALPNTAYKIEIKDFEALTTHNTAILGILGIGKSCLTFELIKKAIEHSEVKIICIDVTNEYTKELPKYINESLIQKDELGSTFLNDLKTTSLTRGATGDPTAWGNKEHYKVEFLKIVETFASNENKRILVLNPDWHAVTETLQKFNITHCEDLTVAQKTRIICERIFINAKKSWELLAEDERAKLKARFLIVFEEAHSLIPEWNSVANEGDQSAANGTGKVILQGRKYGLGSFVVTQRTANISKSILNQCNTIFALRVFDDTGKQFLENYIGSDYANTLPTLEERHAISMGKALKLKQPVILLLNDKKDVFLREQTSSVLTQ